MFTGDLTWDRAAAKAELLRTITREEVLALLDSEMLAEGSAKRVSGWGGIGLHVVGAPAALVELPQVKQAAELSA